MVLKQHLDKFDISVTMITHWTFKIENKSLLFVLNMEKRDQTSLLDNLQVLALWLKHNIKIKCQNKIKQFYDLIIFWILLFQSTNTAQISFMCFVFSKRLCEMNTNVINRQ